MSRGVPYSRELTDAICARVSEGETVEAICAEEGMPTSRTVRNWARDDIDGFAARYDRAYELRTDVLADKLLDMANKATPENAQVLHVQMRIYTHLMARWHPRRYGERIQPPSPSLPPIMVVGVPSAQAPVSLPSRTIEAEYQEVTDGN